MFSKSAEPTTAPQIPQREGRNAAKSIFGPDLELTGEITTSGSLELLGSVTGNIAADQLTIGTSGKLDGALRANNVDIKGKLNGRVDSQSCTLRASSEVKADILYDRLTIENGAQIEGRFAKLR